MQTLQNVGALTASLGPLAGGYGYAGGGPPPQGSNYNSSVYAPVTGSLPAQSGLPGSIGYNPAAAPAPAPAPAGGFSAGIFGGLGGLGSLSGLDFSGYPYG